MFPVEQHYAEALARREERGLLRRLQKPGTRADFSSNDYLGFARSAELRRMVYEAEEKTGAPNGSGGSRLLTGNSAAAEKLESFLARFHNAPAALLFNSGYDANLGLFSCMASKKDTILYDEYIHASVRDGIRLSAAQSFPFRHNNMGHLQERLSLAKGNTFIAVESVYSMDGDLAPLKKLTELCTLNNAHLIVDEAHATGVFSRGLVQECGLEELVFARLHTFGKALGCHGAAVTGSPALKQYLINHARSFIYTTALPHHSLLAIHNAYRLLRQSGGSIKRLHELIAYFRAKAMRQQKTFSEKTGLQWLDSKSAIQSLIVPGNANTTALAHALQKRRLDVRPILSPTVPRGRERLRICLHVYNTEMEIDRLMHALNIMSEKYQGASDNMR
ncbi:MAG: 8-amino-7-oxononanoate synthase [Bacteroidia bacterium]|nr:8-amino-7-oxononanoate synthase [Bacteroidia bacterium]